MALEVRIEGSAELKRLAAQIRARGDKGLGAEMARALKKASDPVQRAIRAEYTHLPARGGYSGTFSKSLRFRTTLRAQTRNASFRLLTFADGKHEKRDIKALEGGRLRHPVFGHRRRAWSTTRVGGGYWQRGTDRAINQAESGMIDVLDDFASRLLQ